MTSDAVRSGSASGQAGLIDALAAAEPTAARRLGELIGRLEADGCLRTVRPPNAAASSGEAASIAARPVRGIVYDSRRVTPGSVFVAVPGEHVNGHDYLDAAVAAGASALIVERPGEAVGVPQLVVDRSQAALAGAASWWFGEPSLELGVVGITGTDGKTTTSFLAEAALEAAGISTGLLTTAEIKIGDRRGPNPEHVTTPQAPELQRALRAMVRAGNRAAVVETTSHGLALERVAGIAYDVAVFTNLTHEHLELHGTFEAYREAKLGLFRRLRDAGPAKPLPRPWPRAAIVNHDDPSASLFEAAALSARAGLVRYGYSPEAEVRAIGVEEDAAGQRILVTTPRWEGEVILRLVGRFNVHNALAAIALGEVLELDPAAIRAGLAGVRGVPGRMERVDCGQPFGVVVDYAHSPASLQIVLDHLAPPARAGGGGVIAVFGSAGERDVQKRPMMGRVAAERCRLVVVTDEDPRGEDREAILDAIAAGAEAAGMRRGENLLLIPDRREAIAAAFGRAAARDIVLLAGKGHEQSIIMGDGAHAWDERSEAAAALKAMGYRCEEGE